MSDLIGLLIFGGLLLGFSFFVKWWIENYG